MHMDMDTSLGIPFSLERATLLKVKKQNKKQNPIVTNKIKDIRKKGKQAIYS